MDRFGPARKGSKKLVNLLRWTTSPGRTGLIEKRPVYSTTPTPRGRSIQPKIPEISVQNSMDWFRPARKGSKKLVNLLRWTTSPGRTGLIEKWPVHSTTPTHSHSQCVAVRYILGVYPSKNGGFSLLVQLLWHNCTQPGKFAIPPVSSYCRYVFGVFICCFCKNNITQLKSQSVFASRLRPFPPKPIRPEMLTFQPPTRALSFYSSNNSFSSTNPYLFIYLFIYL